MKAPQIDNFIRCYRNEKYELVDNCKLQLNELYSLLENIEPCGDDEKRVLWFRAERGGIEDYGNYEELLEEDIVETREQFEQCWQEEYPDEYCWYEFVFLRYREYRSVFLNRVPIIQVAPENQGFEHDISAILSWLIEQTQATIDMMKLGKYESWINDNLPYKYRRGTVETKKYWELYPQEEAEHFDIISKDEVSRFSEYLSRKTDGNERIGKMTVNFYLELCRIGYTANKLKGTDVMSPLELYRRYADDRDGGLLTIDPDSSDAFDNWFNLSHDEKWKIENPSHQWEVIQGSSRTRVHLSVLKDNQGYYLILSCNEFCCSEYAVRFYNALKSHDIPVEILNGKRIAQYLNGEGKIGIVPCFENPTDYFYGGFRDESVGEFINLPDMDNNKLVEATQWEPITIAKPKSRQV